MSSAEIVFPLETGGDFGFCALGLIHNPDGPECDYANIHWGHAVSTDLVHWRELPPALKPDREGPIFSGTCVVDWENTSGLQAGDENVLMAFYTAAGYILPENKPATQCMAYSNDRGRTWTKYSGNPVVGNITRLNRDPKVFWHEPTKRWIMAISLSCGAWLDGDYWFAFFASPDLRTWEERSRFEMPRGIDCPDMFELPLDDGSGETRWVFWAGDGTHAIGTFDGIEFKQEGDVRLPLIQWDKKGGPIGYSAQTYSNMPAEDDRVVQISWLRHHGTYPDSAFEQGSTDGAARSSYPEMPFDQQASFPCELALRTFSEGVLLCREPVDEIALLYGEHRHFASKVFMSFCLFFDSDDKVLQVYCSEGSATAITLDVFELRSAWGGQGSTPGRCR